MVVEFDRAIVLSIIIHWDKNEALCAHCETYWASLTTAQRREIRHDYDFEKDIV